MFKVNNRDIRKTHCLLFTLNRSMLAGLGKMFPHFFIMPQKML